MRARDIEKVFERHRGKLRPILRSRGLRGV